MIELLAQDGSRIFLNPDAVWHLRSSGADQTAIYATSGTALFVQGNVDDIKSRLADWTRANRRRSITPALQVVRDDNRDDR